MLMPNGLFIHYPQLSVSEGPRGPAFAYNSRNGWVDLYGGKFDENLIQSTARTIVALQAVEIAKRYRIVLLVHDEVVYLVPESEAEEGLQYGLDCLSTPPDFCRDLPVEAEGGYATNYSK